MKRSPADASTFDRDYFIGRKKSNYGNYPSYHRKSRRHSYIRLFRKYGGGSYLDIGCAFGFLVRYASDYFDRSVGVDLSAFAVEKAQGLHPHSTFIQCDAADLPFKDVEFDFITALDVLEHTQDLPKTFASVARVLRRGGWLFADIPCAGFLRRHLGWLDKDITHISILSRREYERIISACGLTVVKESARPPILNASVSYLLRKM